MVKRTEAVLLWIKFIFLMAAPYRLRFRTIVLTLRAGSHSLPLIFSMAAALSGLHSLPLMRLTRTGAERRP
jgi:hypothetical protein